MRAEKRSEEHKVSAGNRAESATAHSQYKLSELCALPLCP